MHKLLGLLIAFSLALSCSTTRNTGKDVEQEIEDKLKLRALITATGDGYTLSLRENNFFDYQGKSPTETKSNLYAGTWERKADSLLLGFHSNHHPRDLTGTGIIDEKNSLIILFSKELRHRRLVIQR